MGVVLNTGPRPSSDSARFPGVLESIGVKLIGSYVPVGQPLNETPGIMIIETDDPANLQQIMFYYMPYLTYSFSLYQPVPRPV